MPYEALIFHAFFPRHVSKKFHLSESDSLFILVKTSLNFHYFKFLCSVLSTQTYTHVILIFKGSNEFLKYLYIQAALSIRIYGQHTEGHDADNLIS